MRCHGSKWRCRGQKWCLHSRWREDMNQYGKAFLARPEEDNPRFSEQKGLRNLRSLRRVLQGLGMQTYMVVPVHRLCIEGVATQRSNSGMHRLPQQGDCPSGSGKGYSELVHGQGSQSKDNGLSERRPNTFCIPSPPVSFPVWCILESHNSFSLSVDPREPEPDGRSSFPARLMPWFHLSIFIVVLTEVFETNRRVRISRSGSMICKWRVFRSSGGKHGSSYMQSFASVFAWYFVVRLRNLVVASFLSVFKPAKNKMGHGLAHRPVIVGVSRDLRGDSWGYVPRSLFWWEELDKDRERGFDLCSSFVEGPPRRCRASREDPIRASKGRPSNRKGGYVIIKYLKDVKKRKKSKSAKQKEKFEWKPTGQIFKTVGLKWIPTGQTLTTTVIPVDEPLDMPMPGNPSLDHS
ncbi:hypothetical protein Tco_1021172 [Tanacetum coccineum]